MSAGGQRAACPLGRSGFETQSPSAPHRVFSERPSLSPCCPPLPSQGVEDYPLQDGFWRLERPLSGVVNCLLGLSVCVIDPLTGAWVDSGHKTFFWKWIVLRVCWTSDSTCGWRWETSRPPYRCRRPFLPHTRQSRRLCRNNQGARRRNSLRWVPPWALLTHPPQPFSWRVTSFFSSANIWGEVPHWVLSRDRVPVLLESVF